MFLFYLRQTVPFKIVDLFKLVLYFIGKRNTILLSDVEREIARRIGTKYAVLSDSMRKGLQLSLTYCMKKNPDKNTVLLPEYSFHSNLSAVLNLGLKAKFIPVNDETLEVNLDTLGQYVDEKTLGVVLTHIHGLIYPMEKMKRIQQDFGIFLFEDCAHVFDAKLGDHFAGSVGIGCFSFGPGKNATCFGGGAITTNDSNLYRYLKIHQKQIRSFGADVLVMVKTVIYTFASMPFFSYLIMKPVLGMQLLRKRNLEEDHFRIRREQLLFINTPTLFQLGLLHYQLSCMKSEMRKIINKRICLGKIYDSMEGYLPRLIKSNTFFFQYPIMVKDPESFIMSLWLKNIDVQRDYCSYLPSLVCGENTKEKWRNMVYLPTNQYLPEEKIKEIYNIVKEGRLRE